MLTHSNGKNAIGPIEADLDYDKPNSYDLHGKSVLWIVGLSNLNRYV